MRQAKRSDARQQERMQRLRDRWWRTAVEQQLTDLLLQSLREIRKTDPTFEARMLAGWGATVSIHAVNPDRMEELVEQGQVSPVKPSLLLDAAGLPIQ